MPISSRLGSGGVRVYHGSPHRATLQELRRTYRNLVEDTTRVMLRLKALFRARAIPTPGTRVYQPMHRAHWLGQLPDRGVRFRAETLYTELDIYRARRPPGPPALSEDGPPGGSPGRSRVVRVVDHSVSGPGSCRIAARHAPDTVAIPDQATPLGLCRPRGYHRDQRRARAPARSASATPAARASASATARRGMQCAMNLSGRPATAVSVALQS